MTFQLFHDAPNIPLGPFSKRPQQSETSPCARHGRTDVLPPAQTSYNTASQYTTLAQPQSLILVEQKKSQEYSAAMGRLSLLVLVLFTVGISQGKKKQCRSVISGAEGEITDGGLSVDAKCKNVRLEVRTGEPVVFSCSDFAFLKGNQSYCMVVSWNKKGKNKKDKGKKDKKEKKEKGKKNKKGNGRKMLRRNKVKVARKVNGGEVTKMPGGPRRDERSVFEGSAEGTAVGAPAEGQLRGPLSLLLRRYKREGKWLKEADETVDEKGRPRMKSKMDQSNGSGTKTDDEGENKGGNGRALGKEPIKIEKVGSEKEGKDNTGGKRRRLTGRRKSNGNQDYGNGKEKGDKVSIELVPGQSGGAHEDDHDGCHHDDLDGASAEDLDGASDEDLDGASDEDLDGASDEDLDGASDEDNDMTDDDQSGSSENDGTDV
ncbi:spore wall protein 2-like [Penaeus chinensis]|uniref:spore wall protein 2-like n=1 Tax=Penaeus chinensis TaxID=139456 RepID=UPI001FB85B6D|nr:spore wall protein 2-like [Penaeus chinensis]